MVKHKKLQVKVKVLATPKLEIRFGYSDIYEYIYEDIYDYISPNERRDMGSLLDEENPEAITWVKIDTNDLCEIYDRLSEQYATECNRLNKECEELFTEMENLKKNKN